MTAISQSLKEKDKNRNNRKRKKGLDTKCVFSRLTYQLFSYQILKERKIFLFRHIFVHNLNVAIRNTL